MAQTLRMRLQGANMVKDWLDRDADGVDAMFRSDSSVITVDANRNPGRIIAVSSNAAQLLNQPGDLLIGKMIGSILLPPFADEFDEIIQRYLDKRDEKFFNMTMKTFVKLANHGWCLV